MVDHVINFLKESPLPSFVQEHFNPNRGMRHKKKNQRPPKGSEVDKSTLYKVAFKHGIW
jgi:hypothetical protein